MASYTRAHRMKDVRRLKSPSMNQMKIGKVTASHQVQRSAVAVLVYHLVGQ